ncbi:MAG: hypothetical protein HYY52_00710 [Candidatus Melainabacteria bacterium]|nr:hypothetical protein [Candidatus Melainabacteria bacterium]
MLTFLIPKKTKEKTYEPPHPNEIRKILKKMTHCPHCHFLIFDNYWSKDIENPNVKLCPTCGCKI